MSSHERRALFLLPRPNHLFLVSFFLSLFSEKSYSCWIVAHHLLYHRHQPSLPHHPRSRPRGRPRSSSSTSPSTRLLLPVARGFVLGGGSPSGGGVRSQYPGRTANGGGERRLECRRILRSWPQRNGLAPSGGPADRGVPRFESPRRGNWLSCDLETASPAGELLSLLNGSRVRVRS